MVARRLAYLTDRVDLSDVRQILDIGSWHLGQSIEFSQIFPNAKIDAFEPVPDSYQLCLKKLNNLNNKQKELIRVHNLALNDSKGEIPFYPVDSTVKQSIDMGFSSMFKIKEGVFNETFFQNEIKVQSDTLDNWCEENNVNSVDIIWIDVQGAELHVFKGAENILKNTRIILTEVGLKPYYEGHTLKEDIDKLLFGLGFKELDNSFELNVADYEANTIYIKK